jgi:glycosyltransferase involved in cell wall biosynthesis
VKALVVVPAYRESGRIGALLDGVPACAAPGVNVSWLVVDDGSGPEEVQALRGLIEKRGLQDRVSVLALERNAGKGAALAAGFRAGLQYGHELLAFIDADGSASPAEAGRLLARLAAEPALAAAIGSRVMMLGRTIRRDAARHYAGRAFATFVSACFGAPVYDTQCGLKAFRAEPLRRHLDAPTDARWVWDTQLLLSFLAAGERVVEVPIDWAETPGSRLGLLDPLRMAWSLLRFRLSRPRGPA